MWTATVTSLKDKAVAMREKLAAAEQSLAGERDRVEQLQAMLSFDKKQLADARVRHRRPSLVVFLRGGLSVCFELFALTVSALLIRAGPGRRA